MNDRDKQYYTEARAAARALWDAVAKLESLQKQHSALDYGNTLPAGTGPHDGITKVEVGAAVFDTANAIRTVLNAGHATNLAKLL